MAHTLTWKRLAKRLRARLLNATDAIAALARVLDKAKARTVELESEALALRERIQSLEKAEADRTCASGLAHEERRANVQARVNVRLTPGDQAKLATEGLPGFAPGTIAWSEHEKAWRAYAMKYGDSQSAERIHERGGFSYCELLRFLGAPPRTWRAVARGRKLDEE